MRTKGAYKVAAVRLKHIQTLEAQLDEAKEQLVQSGEESGRHLRAYTSLHKQLAKDTKWIEQAKEREQKLVEVLEAAQLITEKYVYADTVGWVSMEPDDVSKLWQLIEDALEPARAVLKEVKDG